MSIIPKALAKVFVDDCDFDEAADDKVISPIVPEVREIGKIIAISVADIMGNPSQPRRVFSPEELTGLAKSISSDGIIQPLSVRRIVGGFELISGERRLRAAKMAGMRTVPCIVIGADSKRSAVMSLIENIQRENLNFFEEASAIRKLIDTYNLTQDEIAMRLGMAQSTVANKLRILRLTEDERNVICEAKLSERHARALLKIEDTDLRRQTLLKIVKCGWNVSQTEKYIKDLQEQEIRKKCIHKSAVMLKDVRLFFNTVDKALDIMKQAGVDAAAKRVNHDDYIEYIIRIPSKEKQV